MSLSIASLNSGSNGNCYYIGNDTDAILVDAGISCRETEKRLKRLALSIKMVRAIFVSHEHTDHIKGVSILAKKYQLPVFITRETLVQGGLRLQEHLVIPFRAHEPVTIGGLRITAFPKLHDASDPHSFIIACNGLTIGVFTDIGMACQEVIRYFGQCHAAFLEANYDEEMLEKGRYPYHLKNRIRGEKGHLSNRQALELFKAHKPSFMSHLLLSHLSKDNNSPELVSSLFKRHADGTEIIVASRYVETAVYQLRPPEVHSPEVHSPEVYSPELGPPGLLSPEPRQGIPAQKIPLKKAPAQKIPAQGASAKKAPAMTGSPGHQYKFPF